MRSMFPVWANTKGLATMALAAATVGLTACGGGGGSGGSASTAVTGTFVDAKVQGLGYKCGSASSLSGSTNASGEFTCQSGEAVSFYVGGIKLGAVSAIQAVVTPLDLVGAGATPASAKVKNIVRFLMSISSTLPSGGLLTIPSTVATAASAKSIDFTLDAPSNLDTVIGDVKPVGATAYTATEAETHMRSSISGLFAGDFSGSYNGGGEIGTWTFTINSAGVVTGTVIASDGNVPISGSMTTDPKSGATSIYAFTGTAGDATWIGTLNINTRVFSGTWSNPIIPNGVFTGKTASKPTSGTPTSGGTTTSGGGTLIVSGATAGNGNFSLPIATETAAGGTSTAKRLEFTDATPPTRTLRLYYEPGTGALTAVQYNSSTVNFGCSVGDVVAPCDTAKITFSAAGKSVLLDMAQFNPGKTISGVLEGHLTW